VTDGEGSCEIDGLLAHGPNWVNGRTVPGCRYLIKVTWQGLSCEKVLERFPKEEVQLLLE